MRKTIFTSEDRKIEREGTARQRPQHYELEVLNELQTCVIGMDRTRCSPLETKISEMVIARPTDSQGMVRCSYFASQ